MSESRCTPLATHRHRFRALFFRSVIHPLGRPAQQPPFARAECCKWPGQSNLQACSSWRADRVNFSDVFPESAHPP